MYIVQTLHKMRIMINITYTWPISSPIPADAGSRSSDGLELSTFSSGTFRGSLVPNDVTTSESPSAVSVSSDIATDAPLIHDGISRNIAQESSQNTSVIVQPAPSGNSMFQRYLSTKTCTKIYRCISFMVNAKW